MAYIPRFASLDNKYVATVEPVTESAIVASAVNVSITNNQLGYWFGRGGASKFANTGAAAEVYFTLPESPTIGKSAIFLQDEGSFRCNVVVSGSDTMLGGAGAGKVFAYSVSEGAQLMVRYIGGGIWVAQNFGSWTYG